MDLCIDYNLLFAELKKHGFCLGFSTIEDVALSKEQVDYWHRGNFVCYVKSKGLIATYVCFITGDELKDEFSTYKSVQEYLNFTDTIEAQRRPSIIEAFENVLFTSYSDAVFPSPFRGSYFSILSFTCLILTGFQSRIAEQNQIRLWNKLLSP